MDLKWRWYKLEYYKKIIHQPRPLGPFNLTLSFKRSLLVYLKELTFQEKCQHFFLFSVPLAKFIGPFHWYDTLNAFHQFSKKKSFSETIIQWAFTMIIKIQVKCQVISIHVASKEASRWVKGDSFYEILLCPRQSTCVSCYLDENLNITNIVYALLKYVWRYKGR